MKTPEQVTADIERRLKNTWQLNLDSTITPDWPHTFALGAPTKAALEHGFQHFQHLSLELRRWAASNDLHLTSTDRRVHGTSQPIPTHVTVNNVDSAACLAGPPWTARLTQGRTRLAALRSHSFHGDLARVVRQTDVYSDLDFDLLCTTADWFRSRGHTARGLTPRQVPIPGLHAKWLNSHQPTVATLAGLPDLGLTRAHPPRIHFTYLDRTHRAAGHRWHDSASVGDAMTPAYTPQVVIISENKDTAVGFLPIAGGIAVEGAGTGATTPAAIEWLKQCPVVIYWGDLDADGLTILNQYRREGINAVSVLMDVPTYDTYAEFGTDYDIKGNVIKADKRRALDSLKAHEQQLYERLTDPEWRGYRRVEQERIPLPVALAAVEEILRARAPA